LSSTSCAFAKSLVRQQNKKKKCSRRKNKRAKKAIKTEEPPPRKEQIEIRRRKTLHYGKWFTNSKQHTHAGRPKRRPKLPL
jgi:hypothetical protein